jgi:hypothetical protein
MRCSEVLPHGQCHPRCGCNGFARDHSLCPAGPSSFGRISFRLFPKGSSVASRGRGAESGSLGGNTRMDIQRNHLRPDFHHPFDWHIGLFGPHRWCSYPPHCGVIRSLQRPCLAVSHIQLISRAVPGQACRRESAHVGSHSLLADFRWLLLSATVATVLGAFLIPTFQRLFSRAVLHFQVHRPFHAADSWFLSGRHLAHQGRCECPCPRQRDAVAIRVMACRPGHRSQCRGR